MNAERMLIKELDNNITTAVICAELESLSNFSPDALAVVTMRAILEDMKGYHESMISKYRFDKSKSNKLDNIEKLIEILRDAKSPS